MSDKADKVRMMLMTVPDQSKELEGMMQKLADIHGPVLTDLALKMHNSKVLLQMLERHGTVQFVYDLIATHMASLIDDVANAKGIPLLKASEIATGIDDHMVTLRQELVERMGDKVDGVDVSATLNDIFHKE